MHCLEGMNALIETLREEWLAARDAETDAMLYLNSCPPANVANARRYWSKCRAALESAESELALARAIPTATEEE